MWIVLIGGVDVDIDLSKLGEEQLQELLRCCGGLTLFEAIRTILPQAKATAAVGSQPTGPPSEATNPGVSTTTTTTTTTTHQCNLTEYTMTKIYLYE